MSSQFVQYLATFFDSGVAKYVKDELYDLAEETQSHVNQGIAKLVNVDIDAKKTAKLVAAAAAAKAKADAAAVELKALQVAADTAQKLADEANAVMAKKNATAAAATSASLTATTAATTAAPADQLLQDGPSVAAFVASGYRASAYPPAGYASQSTPAEIQDAIAAQATKALADQQAAADKAAADLAAAQELVTEAQAAVTALPADATDDAKKAAQANLGAANDALAKLQPAPAAKQ